MKFCFKIHFHSFCRYAQALHDAERAISLRFDWFRPWARKGAALLGLGKFEEAEAAYQCALQRAIEEDPQSSAIPSIKDGLRECQRAQKKSKQQSSKAVHVPSTAASSTLLRHQPIAMVPQSTPAAAEEPSSSQSNMMKTLLSSLEKPPQEIPSPVSVDPGYRSGDRSDVSANASTSGTGINMPTMSADEMFAAVQGQYNKVIDEVERLKQLMDSLQAQLLRHKAASSVEAEVVEAENPMPHMPTQPLETEPTEFFTESFQNQDDIMKVEEMAVEEDEAGHTSYEEIAKNISEAPRSVSRTSASEVSTLDGAIEDIEPEPAIIQKISSTEVEPESSPIAAEEVEEEILSRRDTAAATAGASTDHDAESSDHESRGAYSESDHDSKSSGTIDDDEGGSVTGYFSEGSELSDELNWMAGVEAARRSLGIEKQQSGFIAPPMTRSRSTRAHIQTEGEASQLYRESIDLEEDISRTSLSGGQSSATPPGMSRLDLGSLQSILLAAAAKSRRKDPNGVIRVACKVCGSTECPQYQNASAVSRILGRQGAVGGMEVPLSGSGIELLAHQAQHARLCATCGCDCGDHETEGEAAAREAAAQRAHQRRERLLRQQHEEFLRNQPQREKRIAASVKRREAAESAGEMLQCTDCDVLTQAKRGTCGECKSCPGFKIYFATTDANDPEVMFYCSVCGCRAESHPIDSEWQKKEEARKEGEAAAAAAAARARQSYSQQSVTVQRREEAEAYAVLGLHYGADSKAVTRAFKRLALKLHPDKAQTSSSDPAAAEGVHAAFVKVTQAYRLLSGLK